MFRLPVYSDLDPEQDSICFLPLEGYHLVTGPPGTGKTVLAVYRAELCSSEGLQTRLLVYNNTLMQYLGGATHDRGVDASTFTFQSWFCNWYWQAFRQKVPERQPYVLDWASILGTLATAELRVTDSRLDHLIVDEAQDLPKEAWPVLRMTAKNITVFADENQTITPHNSTLREIATALGLREKWQIRKNYRNSREIAQFAATFYTGLPTGIPDLPDRKHTRPRVMYTGEDMKKEVEFVVRYAVSHPRSDVGVMLPYARQMKAFYGLCVQALSGRGSSIPVQMYLAGEAKHEAIDFAVPGVKIVSYASAKGLEFDAVYLPRIDRNMADPHSKETRMRLFTLTSRARDELTIMHTGPSLPEAISHVPPELYERHATMPAA